MNYNNAEGLSIAFGNDVGGIIGCIILKAIVKPIILKVLHIELQKED